MPGLRTNSLRSGDPVLWASLEQVFGSPNDPMPLLEMRAGEILGGRPFILWEGDPQTFQFSYVSESAERILGFPCELWLSDPAFWTGTVVHEEDEKEAVAFCALATGRKEDHDFQYRARTADGRIVWLHDVVKVILGAKGLPVKLRGIMLDVTAEIRG